MATAQTRYNTFWPRLRASFIDAAVLFIPIMELSILFYLIEIPFVRVACYLCASSLYLIYSISLHAYAGQTIGKRLNHIRVISTDDTPLTVRQAVLRDSPAIPFLLYEVFSNIPYISSDESTTLPSFFVLEGSSEVEQALNLLVSVVSLVWCGCEILTMLTNRRRRAVHDFIAGSVVVRLDAEESPREPLKELAAVALLGVMCTVLYHIPITPPSDPPSHKPRPAEVAESIARSCNGPETDKAVPALRRDPVYPTSALSDGTEGWVELAFVVTPDGSVAEPKVTDSTPRGMFDDSALAAVSLWRYCPRSNTVPSRVRLRFEMEDAEPHPVVCDQFENSTWENICRSFLGYPAL